MRIRCEPECEVFLQSIGLRPADLAQVFNGPTASLPLHDGIERGARRFHAMGVLARRRCYIQWREGKSTRTVFGFAVLEPYGWESMAEILDPTWPGGLWLAATHRIGAELVTMQEAQDAALALYQGSAAHSQAKAGALQQTLKRTRGKGKKPASVPVTLRIAPDVLAHWRATGPGWQTRMKARAAMPDTAIGTQLPNRTRSPKGRGKHSISLRIPMRVLARWRSTGSGWQARMVAQMSEP
jgi:uncharacterized protein (DUF4415 family)